jgi:hypothetical protein
MMIECSNQRPKEDMTMTTTTQQITPAHPEWPKGGHLDTMLDLGALAKLAIARLQLNAEKRGVLIPDEATLLDAAEDALEGMASAGNLCDRLLHDLCEVMYLSVDALQELPEELDIDAGAERDRTSGLELHVDRAA